MTHADLVERAVRWLRGRWSCAVVFAEMTTAVSETPDAIGWSRGWSIVVECKTSRSDFLRDRHKPHVRNGMLAMGQARWYLAPAGVLRAEDVPPGYGLAEVRGSRIRVVVDAPPRTERGTQSEIQLLVSAVQRAHLGVRFDHERARWEPYTEMRKRLAASDDGARARGGEHG